MVKKYESRNSGNTFYFHDYETFGIDPRCSQASQFAGIRTDENLNIIEGTELNIYCKTREDQLPSPMACLVTHLTPQRVESQDPSVVFSEYEFSKIIMNEMTQRNTCNIGYNSLNFDDEWSRNLAYRSFLDPYEREWKNGCSRADGMHFVQMAYLFNPSVLNFPQAKDQDGELLFDESGNPLPSFKLEELSAANGIVHENAHDALSDVIALIGVLKKIKESDPYIFDYVMSLRNKHESSGLISNFSAKSKPFLHVSSFYGKKNNSCAVVFPLFFSKQNKNQFHVFDLSDDPERLLQAPDRLKELMFSKNEELEEMNEKRLGLKTITLNKLPAFFDLDMVKGRAKEIGLADKSDLYRKNLTKLKEILSDPAVMDNLHKAFFTEYDNANQDPDFGIYGGFPDDMDKHSMSLIHNGMDNQNLSDMDISFRSRKLGELFVRFKARNAPDSLTEEDRDYWKNFVVNKLSESNAEVQAEYTFTTFFEELKALRTEYADDVGKIKILKELEDFGYKRMEELGLSDSPKLRSKRKLT